MDRGARHVLCCKRARPLPFLYLFLKNSTNQTNRPTSQQIRAFGCSIGCAWVQTGQAMGTARVHHVGAGLGLPKEILNPYPARTGQFALPAAFARLSPVLCLGLFLVFAAIPNPRLTGQ